MVRKGTAVTRILYALHNISTSLNIVIQLLIGALLVSLLDLRYLLAYLQRQTIGAPWLMIAIPAGATVAWIILATIALHYAIHQGPVARATDDIEDTDGIEAEEASRPRDR